MMTYVIVAVFILLTTLMLYLAFDKFDDMDHFLAQIIAGLFAIIFAALTVIYGINAVFYTGFLLNKEAYCIQQEERREAYVNMLDKFDTLAKQDVTASETYLMVYKEVTDFNTNIRQCEAWCGTIWEGLLCDPSYQGIEPISLNKGA